MPVAQTVQSPSNTALQLSRGDDQGLVIGFATAPGTGLPDKIAFFGGTPTAPITPTGLTATSVAGSTTTVFVNTAWTAGLGSTAYTIADVIFALKTLNILKN